MIPESYARLSGRTIDEPGHGQGVSSRSRQDGLHGKRGRPSVVLHKTELVALGIGPFWLAEAQAMADYVGAATATFERAVASMNDVGLLAEEVDPRTGEMIGNFPQAFSHIGLISAAWAISEGRQRTGRT
jgi:GH15 family glucan-1,4-alpha-glucosidase